MSKKEASIRDTSWLADCLVPPHQGQLLYDALLAKGTDVSIQLHEGVGHGGAYWFTSHFKQSIVDFFVKHLQDKNSSE